MLLAVIGAIRGDLPALRAVLQSVDQSGIHTLLQTGDLVEGGPQPDEVIGLLSERQVPCVRGAVDRSVAKFVKRNATLRKRLDPVRFAACQRAHEALSAAHIEWLDRLPRHRELLIDGTRILLCHGAFASQNEILSQDTPEMWFLRERERTESELVVSGGAEQPFHRAVAGTLFVGPGVIRPAPDQAAWMLVNTEVAPWSSTIVTAVV